MAVFRLNGEDLDIDGRVLHVSPTSRMLYVRMMTPGVEAGDAKAVRRVAHETMMALGRGPGASRAVLLGEAAHLVESFQAPSSMTFFGHPVVEGTWIAGFRFRDTDWPKVLAQLGDGNVQDVAHKSGGDEMNTRDALFVAAVRGKAFQDREFPRVEVGDADLVLVRQEIDEALRPLIFQLQEIALRLRRVTTGIGQVEPDVFGASVRRPETPTATEQLAAKTREAADPFGSAVREARPPLVSRHATADYLLRKRRR